MQAASSSSGEWISEYRHNQQQQPQQQHQQAPAQPTGDYLPETNKQKTPVRRSWTISSKTSKSHRQHK